MKKLLLILIALPMIGFGQDYIILKTGEEVAVEIIEHNDNSISYFKYKSNKKIDSSIKSQNKTSKTPFFKQFIDRRKE